MAVMDIEIGNGLPVWDRGARDVQLTRKSEKVDLCLLSDEIDGHPSLIYIVLVPCTSMSQVR